MTRPARLAFCLFALLLAGVRAHAALTILKEHRLVKKAASLYASGRYGEVIKTLNPPAMQILRGRELERAYIYLAESEQKSGRLPEALGVYQLAVKLFPDDAELLADLGDLLHSTGLEEQAKPLFEEVLRMNPSNVRANLGLAEIDAALGFYRRSKAHYLSALNTPVAANARIWREYAELLWRMGDDETAEAAARQSLALSSSTASEIDLAFIERSEGRLDGAIALLGRVCARNPGRTDAALARGLWLLEAGRFKEAQAAAQAALGRTPKNPLAHWLLAAALLRQNKPRRQALAELRAASQDPVGAPFVARAAQAELKILGAAEAQTP